MLKILFCVLTLLSLWIIGSSCNPRPNEMAYDLKSGNKVFLRALKESDIELAKKQAIYLASNYGKDGLALNAPDVLKYLQDNNLNIDSLVSIEDERMRKVSEYAQPDPYEKMHIAFEGMPEVSENKTLA